MLVSSAAIFGTIGRRGQLEIHGDRRRSRLAGRRGRKSETLRHPLGPEIGQCCGGRVELAISVIDAIKREENCCA